MCTPGSSAPRRVARHSRDKQNPSTNAAPTKRRRSSSRRETSLETAKAIGPWPLRAPSPTPRTATQQSPHTTSRATWDSGISLLDKAGLTLDEVTAKTFESKLDSFERLDRMLASAEARRNNALREIDRHREALGRAVRQAIDEVQDAEFRDVETGSVGGVTPPP